MKYQEIIDMDRMEESSIYVFDDGKEDIEVKTKYKNKCYGRAVGRFGMDKTGEPIDLTNNPNFIKLKNLAIDSVKNSLWMLKTGGEELLEKARIGMRDIPDVPKENPFKIVYLDKKIGSVYKDG